MLSAAARRGDEGETEVAVVSAAADGLVCRARGRWPGDGRGRSLDSPCAPDVPVPSRFVGVPATMLVAVSVQLDPVVESAGNEEAGVEEPMTWPVRDMRVGEAGEDGT